MEMSEYGQYAIEMKHDQGVVTITTTAHSMKGAKQIILTAERAPERAIRKITFTPIPLN